MPERLVAFSKADIRVMVLVSLRQRSANGLKGRWDRGRKRRAPSPPSESGVRFSRDKCDRSHLSRYVVLAQMWSCGDSTRFVSGVCLLKAT